MEQKCSKAKCRYFTEVPKNTYQYNRLAGKKFFRQEKNFVRFLDLHKTMKSSGNDTHTSKYKILF